MTKLTIDIIKGSTEQEISTILDDIAMDIVDGNEMALEWFVLGHKLELFGKELKERLRAFSVSEVGDDKQEVFGLVVGPRNAVKYDYSNSPIWKQYNSEAARIKLEMDKIQEVAKNTKNPVEIIDEETAEILYIYPAVKIETSTIECRFVK